jgi:hypothetical protein
MSIKLYKQDVAVYLSYSDDNSGERPAPPCSIGLADPDISVSPGMIYTFHRSINREKILYFFIN